MDDQLFNCAAVLHRGRVLGVVPKSFIPNYKEFYEGRWFAAAATARSSEIVLGGSRVPFGTDLLFDADRRRGPGRRRRDLRGPVGADAAQFVPGAARAPRCC